MLHNTRDITFLVLVTKIKYIATIFYEYLPI